MRSDTQTISIEASPVKVFKFLADVNNLTRWAVAFAKNIRKEKDQWIVSTTTGEIGLRLSADERTGVVDYWMSPAPGVEVLAASRVIPRGAASEYCFTQFHPEGMPDEAFRQSVQALKHELTVLKALLEVECPL